MSRQLKRDIRAYPEDHCRCSICGKDTARRKGKAPAPILLVLGIYVEAICMSCAKKISSCLDAVIERIEGRYT